MSNPTQFELNPFALDTSKFQPNVSGHLCAHKDNFEIQFHTVQTQNNIEWMHSSPATSKNIDRRCDNLWKHTCFELFAAPVDSHFYREFNFSPSGQWNSYDFNDYRQQQHSANIDEPPHIKFNNPTPDTYLLSIKLSPQSLSLAPQNKLQLGITAVIQYIDQSLDHYALTHCAQQPDFHLKNSFTLNISP